MSAPSRSLVIGTAGHIDHGKTTLVKALTGTDTDRLPEEKRRGITIELGFAPWQIDDKLQASIIDVPGHEGFVRTMVAGAGGFDLVIFVISAEDGVMPQTREHLRVCELLGVHRAVVALTKIDRLGGEEEIELAADDVRETLAGTVYAEAPIVPCSALAGTGLDRLRAEIIAAAAKLPKRPVSTDPILPVDRVFTIKGHGTVVTGTLLAGRIDADEELSLRLIPTGGRRESRALRARAVQVRGHSTGRSIAGTRTALNLGGVQVAEISRGDVITGGARVIASDALHVSMRHLAHAHASWRSGTGVQVCAGTAHTAARLDPLALYGDDGALGDAAEGLEVAPGMHALVRLRLDVPIPTWRGQRVIVRAFNDPAAASQGLTIGGGHVVDPRPSEGRRQRARWVAIARALERDDVPARLLALVEDAGAAGIDSEALTVRAGVDDPRAPLAALCGAKAPLLALPGGRYILRALVEALVRDAVTAVDRYHATHPLHAGIARATLEASLPGRATSAAASAAIDTAIERGLLRVADRQGALARPGKGALSADDLPPKVQAIYDLYRRGGIAPPTLKDLETATGMDAKAVLEIVGLLQRAELLIKVTPELSLEPGARARIVELTRAHLREHGEIDVQAFKTLTGLSRKFVVPLLELLDRQGITLRRGEVRVAGPSA